MSIFLSTKEMNETLALETERESRKGATFSSKPLTVYEDVEEVILARAVRFQRTYKIKEELWSSKYE